MIKKNNIKIKVNSKIIVVKSNSSINNLIIKLKIPIKKVAIELNNKILDKKKLKKIFLNSNDKLEIVHFIGGG